MSAVVFGQISGGGGSGEMLQRLVTNNGWTSGVENHNSNNVDNQ